MSYRSPSPTRRGRGASPGDRGRMGTSDPNGVMWGRSVPAHKGRAEVARTEDSLAHGLSWATSSQPRPATPVRFQGSLRHSGNITNAMCPTQAERPRGRRPSPVRRPSPPKPQNVGLHARKWDASLHTASWNVVDSVREPPRGRQRSVAPAVDSVVAYNGALSHTAEVAVRKRGDGTRVTGDERQRSAGVRSHELATQPEGPVRRGKGRSASPVKSTQVERSLVHPVAAAPDGGVRDAQRRVAEALRARNRAAEKPAGSVSGFQTGAGTRRILDLPSQSERPQFKSNYVAPPVVTKPVKRVSITGSPRRAGAFGAQYASTFGTIVSWDG